MKKIWITLLSCVLFSSALFAQEYKKLEEKDVNKEKVLIAHNFASKFLLTLKSGEAYKFQNEAIDALKNQLTEENQKNLYQQLKNQLGDFVSLEYTETWIQESADSFQIFRFKGDFEKMKGGLEIRVVVDESDKIAGFWILPWSELIAVN